MFTSSIHYEIIKWLIMNTIKYCEFLKTENLHILNKSCARVYNSLLLRADWVCVRANADGRFPLWSRSRHRFFPCVIHVGILCLSLSHSRWALSSPEHAAYTTFRPPRAAVGRPTPHNLDSAFWYSMWTRSNSDRFLAAVSSTNWHHYASTLLPIGVPRCCRRQQSLLVVYVGER